MLKKLFEPITINGMELKNRMVVSAMVTQYANTDGTATEQFIRYHETKAEGGWGLIITEDYIIRKDAGGYERLPGLFEDNQIESHKQLTDRVHAAGGKIAAQIYHAGRETSSAITGVQPIGPSALKEPSMPEIPHALTVEEIHELVEDFGDCALRAKTAGFDAVEIHGAHGYLINQFTSPFSNKRSDEYGGTLENRARFAVEIIKNVRKKVGDNYPIIYRMSAIEGVPGGLEIEESKAIAKILEEAGVDLFHVSQGTYVSVDMILPPSVMPKACFIDNAAEIKKVVSVPVIGVGKITEPYVAEAILESGKADLVTMARASLADPALPNKARNGECADIIRCIGCLQGCTGQLGINGSVRCLVNPMTGMEWKYDLTTLPANMQKTVYVAGGGVAGCSAAIAAAKKGHRVTLYEQKSELGGQWKLAAVPIGKSDFASLIAWQNRQLKKLNVNVVLGKELTADIILKESPDAVIVATGSTPIRPNFAGSETLPVYTAHEMLEGNIAFGNNIVVVGGGLVGAETADLLAEHGSHVTIIELQPVIVKDGEPTPTKYLLKRLQKNQVDIYT